VSLSASRVRLALVHADTLVGNSTSNTRLPTVITLILTVGGDWVRICGGNWR
jgi:hypothetical protein